MVRLLHLLLQLEILPHTCRNVAILFPTVCSHVVSDLLMVLYPIPKHCIHVPGPLLMVIEYAKFGNLRQFLRDRRPTHGEFIDTSTEEDSSADGEKRTSEEPITLSDLVSFAFQIARGMEYLESNKVSTFKFVSDDKVQLR